MLLDKKKITDEFIRGFFSALPKEGFEKFKELLSKEAVSEEEIEELAKKYNIDLDELAKKIMEEKK